ncbi:MAG: oxidoreductase [Rhodospirillaceae bacterium]|nr:MAG: oxidoreductase [Rhodospirillaceae bacterium]
MDILQVRVARIWQEAGGIKGFELVSQDGQALPPFTAGAHIGVHLPNGVIRHYSMCNDPGEGNRYELGVLKSLDSRGGSNFMHDQVKVGDLLKIDAPRNNFQLKLDAETYILIAGGIGVTPLLSMARALNRTGRSYRLYYCTRTAEMTAYRDLLAQSDFAGKIEFVHDGGDPKKGLDLAMLLREVPANGRIYCCGPSGLMAAVKASAAHWPSDRVHFEAFSASPELRPAEAGPDQAFEVELASSGKVLSVGADESLLNVLRDNGIFIPSACEEGICGTCIVNVLEGEPDHRDQILTDEERAANNCMTVCCSRAKTPRLKLDL